MRTVVQLKRDVSGHLASATDDNPLIITKYNNNPYRAIVPIDWYERAAEALREKEAAERRKQEEAA